MKVKVVLHPENEGGYSVAIPALPGCVSCGELERKGWRFARIKSSHHIYISPDGLRSVPVAVHGNKTLPIRTQRVIMGQTGLSTADL